MGTSRWRRAVWLLLVLTVVPLIVGASIGELVSHHVLRVIVPWVLGVGVVIYVIVAVYHVRQMGGPPPDDEED